MNISNKDILFDEINFIHSIAPDKWALSLRSPEELRVHFAGLIIFTFLRDSIWISVNPDLVDSSHEDIWKWDDSEYSSYKKYKNIEIRNGYLTNLKVESWDKIKEAHFDIIKKIASKKYAIGDKTIKNHDNQLLIELTEGYDKEFPFPSYSLAKEFENSENKNEALTELIEISDNKFLSTEKSAIIRSRIGQRSFRENLLNQYKKCMICGLENISLLRSSHIKSWSQSNNDERLDIANGLLLCSIHDALFDKGLISFSNTGKIKVSESISKQDLSILNLEGKEIKVFEESKKYLKWHREKIFKK